ncbi:MAG: DNA mismatch repair protein MutS, partial [Oscillospiraceae bacterium]|nr:DNA mismatch repair protein MutS [Oscillospiraceae bacterium]
MMKQYLKIKSEHSDCILFFRLGDFYEMFNEDAKLASKELELTLTTRDRNKEDPEERTPMCGVPYHSADAYIARLIAKGYKVAICEQTEDPALAKGLVDREVIRIVTPGTRIEPAMLEEGRSNYLCSVYSDSEGLSAAFCDVSTGELNVSAYPAGGVQSLINDLNRYQPAEAVLSPGAANIPELSCFLKDKLGCLTEQGQSGFEFMDSAILMGRQFGKGPDELGLEDEPQAVCAVGGLLAYINETQKTTLSHINRLEFRSGAGYMELDVQTVRNLELVCSMRTGEKKGSLLWVLDKTRTPMGGRLIRSWVTRPLLDPAAISRRLTAVNELFSNSILRGELRLALRDVGDMERLLSRVVYGSAGGRDMISLASSLAALPKLAGLLAPAESNMLRELGALDTLQDIRALIDDTIIEEPPFSVREGGFIKPGRDAEVDRLRSLLDNSTEALAAIETRERERTGKKLKVGYNRVFGYYIDIPRSMSSDVPADYIRKQTLANSERFITDELKALETELLTARDRLSVLEYSIFTELMRSVSARAAGIGASAQAVALIDVIASLAEAAVKNDYCMPQVDLSGSINIKDGRHPIVELAQADTLFVPNDTYLNDSDCRCAIVTGPNMAGKSTYMRQTALIVIMAQIGSFVPASGASIGLIDRVFTRIGASDDLSSGRSTFMVEMTEVADILKNATKRSLIILDEVGRGTSTYDGMAVARAVLEHCADRKKLGAKTLFSTHYHELTELAEQLEGIKNYSISAKKKNDGLIFLRKIVPGPADESYGIEVASLAGVPDSVIRRAKSILKTLE